MSHSDFLPDDQKDYWLITCTKALQSVYRTYNIFVHTLACFCLHIVMHGVGDITYNDNWRRRVFIKLTQVPTHCASTEYKVVYTNVRFIHAYKYTEKSVLYRIALLIHESIQKCCYSRSAAQLFTKGQGTTITLLFTHPLTFPCISLTLMRPTPKLLYIFMNEKRYLPKFMNEIYPIRRERPAPGYNNTFLSDEDLYGRERVRNGYFGGKGVVDIFITKLIQI